MVKKIKLRQPDRSGPSEKTLLQIAEERGLFAQADQKEKENGDASRKRALPKSATRVRVRQEEDEEQDDDALSPTAERVLETMLWTVSLAMLHFTLDVLVQHQYSIDQVQWPQVCIRAVQALMGELPLLLLWLSGNPPILQAAIATPSHENGTLLLTVVAASVNQSSPCSSTRCTRMRPIRESCPAFPSASSPPSARPSSSPRALLPAAISFTSQTTMATWPS